MMNTKGYSVGFSWIFGLVTLFGLGILYIIFQQILRNDIAPVIIATINNSLTIPLADKTKTIANINQYLTYFDFVIYILFFVVIVYMFVVAIRKEGDSSTL